MTIRIQEGMFDLFHRLVVSNKGYMTRWSIVKGMIRFTVTVPFVGCDDFMYRYLGIKLETALNRLRGEGYIVDRDIRKI